MRQAEGDYVQKTLHLMYDGIGERQGLPVLHFGTMILSHHIINLLLHFLCAGERENIPRQSVNEEDKHLLGHMTFRI